MKPDERMDKLAKVEIMVMKDFPLLDIVRELKMVIVDMHEQLVEVICK